MSAPQLSTRVEYMILNNSKRRGDDRSESISREISSRFIFFHEALEGVLLPFVAF
jgi:hypothetical protein